MADINVTPLIDVVLVLLVVFMVITPMLQAGMPVDLPVATQSTTVNDVGQYITISVNDNGWFVEQDEVDEDTILDAINEEYSKNPEKEILVKGDANIEYEKVREVMDLLAENRMTAVKVATGKE
jgi:biopolymer transport protein ExbD